MMTTSRDRSSGTLDGDDTRVRLRCVGVGPACPCASALRRVGLRDEAMPFDWLLSDATLVDRCLTDGFAAFLDSTQYTHPPGALPQCRRRRTPVLRRLLTRFSRVGSRCFAGCNGGDAVHYHDAVGRDGRQDGVRDDCSSLVGVGGGCGHKTLGGHGETGGSDLLFRHHCPACFGAHHRYLLRAATRMMDVIHSGVVTGDDPVVFVWMNIFSVELDSESHHAAVHAEIHALLAILSKHVTHRRFRLLVIECYGGCSFRGSSLVSADDGIVHHRIRGRSVNIGVQFADAIDNALVDRVLLTWAAAAFLVDTP